MWQGSARVAWSRTRKGNFGRTVNPKVHPVDATYEYCCRPGAPGSAEGRREACSLSNLLPTFARSGHDKQSARGEQRDNFWLTRARVAIFPFKGISGGAASWRLHLGWHRHLHRRALQRTRSCRNQLWRCLRRRHQPPSQTCIASDHTRCGWMHKVHRASLRGCDHRDSQSH